MNDERKKWLKLELIPNNWVNDINLISDLAKCPSIIKY